MKLYNNLLLVSVLLFFLLVIAPAQAQPSLYGFKIAPSVDVLVTLATGTKHVCVPGGTTLEVISQMTDTNSMTVTLSSMPTSTRCKSALRNSAEDDLTEKTAYTLSRTDYEKYGFTTRGAIYGALVVPFKYQLRNDKQFTGSASLGSYIGYRFERLTNLGFTATPIIFAGITSVSVKGDTADSTKNLMGATYGVGLIGTFQNSFQSGLVLGFDHVGKNDGYQYNGKPWVSFQIGFSFSQ